jgi:phosphoglycolate phosphatase-like HAD superfamily hydrolase
MPPKGLLESDMDDTLLLGPKPVYVDSLDAALQSVDVELPRSTIDERANEVWGSPFRLVARHVTRDIPLSNESFRKIDSRFLEIAAEKFKEHVTVVPGVVDRLIELKVEGGYKLGITTAAPRDLLTSGVIDEIGLPLELFDQIVCVDDTDVAGRAKPHPYTLQKIMRDLQVPPLNTVMLGDAPSDAEAAQRAGVDFIGVMTGLFGYMGEKELKKTRRKLNVKYIIDNAAQIKPYLDLLERAPLPSKH